MILERQLALLDSSGLGSATTIVVGFKKDLIMEAFPYVAFAYNHLFDQTNTSKSLLRGLEASGGDSVLWLNGDVVFDMSLLNLLRPHIEAERTFVAVNRAEVGDEEVKYRTDAAGNIDSLSKDVVGGRGEAMGVNFVSGADKPALIAALRSCAATDYFERGIEIAIGQSAVEVAAVDVSDAFCVDVDFESDLAEVDRLLASTP
jgi:choline kinase